MVRRSGLMATALGACRPWHSTILQSNALCKILAWSVGIWQWFLVGVDFWIEAIWVA